MWTSGDAYQRFMGRWGEVAADRALDRLQVAEGASWLDIGCGAGAVTARIVSRCRPAHVTAVDTGPAFVATARERFNGAPVEVQRADARDLPFADAAFDATLSGLVLNFVEEPVVALIEAARVTRPGGPIAVWVWDYDDPALFLTQCWRAIEAVQGTRSEHDERGRWRVCTVDGLAAAAADAGLPATVDEVPVPMWFASPDDLWARFHLGVGPAGAAIAALSEEARRAVRAEFLGGLLSADDGTVELVPRALTLLATA